MFINNATYQRETFSEGPIRLPLSIWLISFHLTLTETIGSPLLFMKVSASSFSPSKGTESGKYLQITNYINNILQMNTNKRKHNYKCQNTKAVGLLDSEIWEIQKKIDISCVRGRQIDTDRQTDRQRQQTGGQMDRQTDARRKTRDKERGPTCHWNHFAITQGWEILHFIFAFGKHCLHGCISL